MTKIQVEVINLQPAQGGVTRFDNMFAAQTLLIGPVAAPKNLARNDESITWPPFLFQNITHHDLGSTLGVGLGVIEKVGTAVVSDSHQFRGRFIANLLRKRNPRAKRKLAQLQSRFPEVSIFHKKSDESGWRDLNPRPLEPHSSVLPS